MSDVEGKERTVPRWAWLSLLIGLVMVAIGVVMSQSVGGIIVGLFNLAALVLVLAGLVGVVLGLFNVRIDSRMIMVAAGVVVVAILVLAVVLTGDESSDVAAEDEYGSPQIDGQLPPLSDPIADAAVGMAAPGLAGEDFAGNAVAITNDGEPKAVVFLAHWCPHCQNEVPAVQSWLDETGGVEGVAMYSVATSMDPTRVNWPASAWLDDEGWTVPVIRDNEAGSAMISYGGNAFPYWVFMNSDGSVAGRIAGGVPTEQLEEILRSLT